MTSMQASRQGGCCLLFGSGVPACPCDSLNTSHLVLASLRVLMQACCLGMPVCCPSRCCHFAPASYLHLGKSLAGVAR